MSSGLPKPIAIRLDDVVLKQIDQRRMLIAQQTGEIPTRSDIVRMALVEFLTPPKKMS